jgi:hypothetical protein
VLRWIVRLFGLLVGLVVVVVGLEIVASESGEVVVVRTRDAGGAVHETRLWVVDEGGHAWIRAGSPESEWLARLREQPTVEVVRGGATGTYTAVPVPAERDRLNPRFAEKYGWADAFIGMLFGRDDATPIRLDPASS